MLSEQEKAEQLKKQLYYEDCGYGDEAEDEIELCDFTGEECIGDKLFCEECPIVIDEEERKEIRDWAKRDSPVPNKLVVREHFDKVYEEYKKPKKQEMHPNGGIR